MSMSATLTRVRIWEHASMAEASSPASACQVRKLLFVLFSNPEKFLRNHCCGDWEIVIGHVWYWDTTWIFIVSIVSLKRVILSVGMTARDVNTQSAKTELLYCFWTNDKLKVTSKRCANTTLGQFGLNNPLQGGLRMNDVCFYEAEPIKGI